LINLLDKLLGDTHSLLTTVNVQQQDLSWPLAKLEHFYAYPNQELGGLSCVWPHKCD